MNLPTNHVGLSEIFANCIDLTDYPEGSTLKATIETEKRAPMSLSTVESWLRGLPSACSIPFTCSDIRQILESCGNGHWTDDDYWRFAASRVMAFAQNPKAYGLEGKA